MWRLYFSVFLFLLSLLVLFKAPTNFLWRVAVAITEFPYIPVFVSVIFFCACFFTHKHKVAVLTVTGISTLLFLLPVIQVYLRGKNLETALHTVFPFSEKESHLKQPFSLPKLFTGLGLKEVQPETYTYTSFPDQTLSLDFYRAASPHKRPCVLVIHGGSWSGGDNKQLPALNSYLAQQGYHVAAIQYRLAPKYKSPAPVEDTKTALHYLNTHAETLGIDTCNYILLGRSAGAQIALVAAYTFHDFSIKGVISFYGPADMVWGARFKSSKLVLNTEEVFRNYFGDLIDKVPEKYTEASAYAFAEKNSPPTLLIHGPNDPMVSYDHSVRLNKKLEENQVAHYFLNLPWATHGCDYNINGPSGQISTFSIERFITSVTSSSCKHSPS